MTRYLKSYTNILALVTLFLLAGVQKGAGEENVCRYTMEISYPRGEISGLCIIRKSEDGGALSVINQFGIKAFDAAYDSRRERIRLSNVIGPLDRCRIKRIIAKDLRPLFQNADTAAIFIENKRFGIKYKFVPLRDVEQ